MKTKEAIFFDPSVDMCTSYDKDLFKDGIVVGEAVTVLYGPYISLPAGKWTVTISGHIVPNGHCYVDAAGGAGHAVLGTGQWLDGVSVFQIDCPFPVDTFEVRAYAAPGSFVRIDGVSVERQFDRKENRSFSIFHRMGLSLMLDPTSWVDRCLIEAGSWESGHLDYMTKNALMHAGLSRDMVFLDIGSYFGLYSMIMSRTNVFEKIIAFEADKFNFRQLCANLLLNDPNCIIEPRLIAVSDKAGAGVFEFALDHPDGNRGGVGLNEGNPFADGDERLVVTDTIDNLASMHGKRVFVKIDVEGHELRVLAGMRELISNNKIFIQVETFLQAEDVKEILEPLGCRLVHKIDVDYFFTNFEGVPL